MRRLAVLVAAVAAAAGLFAGAARAQISDQPGTPFKLASFAAAGRAERVGLQVGDRIYDLERANAALQAAQADAAALALPADMKGLIERSDELRPRLFQIANFIAARAAGLDFGVAPGQVSLKAPIKYPWNLLAAGQNYRAHAAELGGETDIDPEQDDPFLFAKSPRSSIADPGEPFVIPPGRTTIDWEGELAVVIGRRARNLTLENALEHVFGFTIVYDVSDRAAQMPVDGRYPQDWFAGKSMDGAAPMGPYVVPKEFLPNYAKLRLTTRVNGALMQNSDTSFLIHDVPRLLRYATRIMTLWPGDVIATGTPEGVGRGRKPEVYLKRGDEVAIEIEGIGTLVTPIR